MSFFRGPELEPAFEAFVVASSPLLLRTAYLLTGDRGHAEDLVQTTFLRTAWRWSAASEQPEAYARRVLINLSRDRWRTLRRRPREQLESDHRELPAGDPSSRVEDSAALTPALRALPTRQREVIVLRFFADLPVADTARALGISEGAVKSYTSRALTRLRELLDEPREVQNADR